MAGATRLGELEQQSPIGCHVWPQHSPQIGPDGPVQLDENGRETSDRTSVRAGQPINEIVRARGRLADWCGRDRRKESHADILRQES